MDRKQQQEDPLLNKKSQKPGWQGETQIKAFDDEFNINTWIITSNGPLIFPKAISSYTLYADFTSCKEYCNKVVLNQKYFHGNQWLRK